MVAEQQRRGRGRAFSLILASKLRPPAVAAGSLQRPRLLEQLNGGTPLTATILAAPAGYGKTVLACQWLEQTRMPSAWLSLEPGDGELPLFLGYLTAAVRAVFPRALPQTESRAPQRLTERELTTLLLNELEVLPARLALVLDDYHLVASAPVNRLFESILRHPPRGLHPVFLTRFDPLLSLDELRPHGELSEIRERDLRFTREKIEEMVTRELGAPVDAELAAAVEEKTEGWPVGLRLGLAARRNRGDPAALASSATGHFDDEHIHRFLASEVLTAQPAQLRRPLLMISVVDRFCAPLCDALLADGDPDAVHPTGREVLDWLSRHNLFISRLGGAGEWYRYHHFFRGLLRAQLEQSRATDVAALRRRAGAWLAGNGFPDEALDQLLAADDLRGAAEIVVSRGQRLLDEGDWPRLGRLLTRFPREQADRDPRILSLETWALMGAGGQGRVLASAVDRIDQLLASGPAATFPGQEDSDLGGSQDVLRGCLALAAGDARDALRLAERGLASLPRTRERQTAFGRALRIVSLQATGDYPAALTAAEDSSLDPVLGANRSRPWELGRAHAAWLEVDLRTVRAGAENLLTHGEEDGLPDLAAAGRYLLGIERYARNDLAGAEEILGPLVDDRAGSASIHLVHGLVALCFTRQALGRSAEAWVLAERLAGLAAERGEPFLLGFAQTAQAELDLHHGREPSCVRGDVPGRVVRRRRLPGRQRLLRRGAGRQGTRRRGRPNPLVRCRRDRQEGRRHREAVHQVRHRSRSGQVGRHGMGSGHRTGRCPAARDRHRRRRLDCLFRSRTVRHRRPGRAGNDSRRSAGPG
ncbi:hypothetical protein E3T24_01010 [Cryobacterium sp. TmT2-59]|uniref:hypothetical protein n=1 Tax=Cryobacterium sp. TmT2-59 TaxID=1259264 RepID=UPI00106BBC7B|nr:hypothetical protein [Cryobacterium sp. TmT2-59]TFC89417.1 hypothetical protein E3T24_01010 [Cryobacterium sp. TmT2-59]